MSHGQPTGFTPERIREEFPILAEGLVYLDSAASAQKPRCVIEAINRYYRSQHANIHRGVYRLSQEATRAYDQSRETVRRFLNAADSSEIVFVRGTTEALNLIAGSFGRSALGEGDEIILTEMEHHSNIVPWQLLAEEKSAKLQVVPVNDRGELRMDAFEELFSERTKLVAVTHISNALGTINPIKKITERAHHYGIPVIVDGAQAAPHIPVDVRELGCDFYAFSGHKVYGPTGIGVLYGRRELLEAMRPYHGGGDMIESVSFSGTTFKAPPERFEAGTPNIAGALGLAAAIEFLESLGQNAIAAHEEELRCYTEARLSELPGIRLIGTAEHKAGVVSFVLDCAHPHDIGTILDRCGVAVRAGHHCAQPLMERFGIPATTRASFAVHTTKADIDALIAGLKRTMKLFG